MRHLLSFFVFMGLPALQAQTYTATPVTLTFSYQAGNALPAAQTVAVKASASTPNYTAVITGSNTLWLTATPDTGKLPATLAVRVNPTSLAVGTYTVVQQASGNITSAGSYSVTGTAIPVTGDTAAITVSGGNVILTITDTTTTTLNALTQYTYGQTATLTTTVAPCAVE